MRTQKNFRVYRTVKGKGKRSALGYWEGVKDNIQFDYYDRLKEAKQEAKNILKATSEYCIAVEDITAKVLYIIYRDKTEILSEYHKINTQHKLLYKRFRITNKNYTLEKTDRGIIAFTYKHIKNDTPKIEKINTPLLPEIYFLGQLI